MIRIFNVQTIGGSRISVSAPSDRPEEIDGSHLTALPALIDPHVHFRTPGAEHKEDWGSGAAAALAGGVTTVLDMPNNTPSCTSLAALEQKSSLVEAQLKRANLPLRRGYYLGATKSNFSEIASCASRIAGIKIFMGSSTGDLLVEDPIALRDLFHLAASLDLIIAVHAEDDELIRRNKELYGAATSPSSHSLIRSSKAAAIAVEKAIRLAETAKARLYIAHVSTKEELSLIAHAKRCGLKVFAEAAPHHLFLNISDYQSLGSKALVNPPLRDRDDVEALWDAVRDGTIDAIGTDHAPHSLAEKLAPYPKAPSGMPSIEFYLALLLDAASQGKISLQKIVELTSERPREIFRLPKHGDLVLTDLEKTRTIEREMIFSKAGWSPYLGLTLKGWPVYTLCEGRLFHRALPLQTK